MNNLTSDHRKKNKSRRFKGWGKNKNITPCQIFGFSFFFLSFFSLFLSFCYFPDSTWSSLFFLFFSKKGSDTPSSIARKKEKKEDGERYLQKHAILKIWEINEYLGLFFAFSSFIWFVLLSSMKKNLNHYSSFLFSLSLSSFLILSLAILSVCFLLTWHGQQ